MKINRKVSVHATRQAWNWNSKPWVALVSVNYSVVGRGFGDTRREAVRSAVRNAREAA